MPLGRTWGPPFITESYLLFQAMTTPPTASRKFYINQLVASLKAQGIWAKLDLLYVLAAADAQASLLNWISPFDAFTATNVSAMAFVVDRGYTGDGVADYLDTGWDPATNGVNFTQNSAHLGAYVVTAGGGSNQVGRVSAGVPNLVTARDSGSGSSLVRINAATQACGATVASPLGHTVGVRTASTTSNCYKTGLDIDSDATASTALDSGDITIGRGGGTFGTDEIAIVHLGAGLSAAEVLVTYNAFHLYLQNVAGIA